MASSACASAASVKSRRTILQAPAATRPRGLFRAENEVETWGLLALDSSPTLLGVAVGQPSGNEEAGLPTPCMGLGAARYKRRTRDYERRAVSWPQPYYLVFVGRLAWRLAGCLPGLLYRPLLRRSPTQTGQPLSKTVQPSWFRSFSPLCDTSAAGQRRPLWRGECCEIPGYSQ